MHVRAWPAWQQLECPAKVAPPASHFQPKDLSSYSPCPSQPSVFAIFLLFEFCLCHDRVLKRNIMNGYPKGPR